jgi:3-deoxy-manno-octulosonate cytidylyltransferase (CMP-KDO synthetase)
MIQRVYQQALKCTALSEVIVATDNDLIAQHVKTFGNVVMTSPDHVSGTDRCREAISLVNKGQYAKDDVVVNIQGDEPFIHPLQIELLLGFSDDARFKSQALYKQLSVLKNFLMKIP